MKRLIGEVLLIREVDDAHASIITTDGKTHTALILDVWACYEPGEDSSGPHCGSYLFKTGEVIHC